MLSRDEAHVVVEFFPDHVMWQIIEQSPDVCHLAIFGEKRRADIMLLVEGNKDYVQAYWDVVIRTHPEAEEVSTMRFEDFDDEIVKFSCDEIGVSHGLP